MDFLKNIQEQFQVLISDMNLECSENVMRIQEQIERGRRYIEFMNECTELQQCLSSYALKLQDDKDNKERFLIQVIRMMKQEMTASKQELSYLRAMVAQVPQETVQKIADVYQTWIHTMHIMDEFSKKTISKLWESNDELGRVCKSQAERLTKKDQVVSILTKEKEELEQQLKKYEHLEQRYNELLIAHSSMSTFKDQIEQQLRDIQEQNRVLIEEKEKRISQLQHTKSIQEQELCRLRTELDDMGSKLVQTSKESENIITELRAQLLLVENKYQSDINSLNRTNKQEYEHALSSVHVQYRKSFITILDTVKKIRADQSAIKSALLSLQHKYVHALYNESDTPKVSLESIMSGVMMHLLALRDRRETGLRSQIENMEVQQKQIIKDNIQLQRKITDALSAYRRLQKHIKKLNNENHT